MKARVMLNTRSLLSTRSSLSTKSSQSEVGFDKNIQSLFEKLLTTLDLFNTFSAISL
jgi:hypothetical protein